MQTQHTHHISAAAVPVRSIFHEPSANGELAPPPSAPLPGVPGMPDDFRAPRVDDAARGADAIDG